VVNTRLLLRSNKGAGNKSQSKSKGWSGKREPNPLPLLSAFTPASYLPYLPAPVAKGGALGDMLVGLNSAWKDTRMDDRAGRRDTKI